MIIDLHVSEINAAIALFSGVAERIREQDMAQAMPPQPPQEEPPAENAGGTD